MYSVWFSWFRFYFLRLTRRYPFVLASGLSFGAVALAMGVAWFGLARHEVALTRDIANADKSLAQPLAIASQPGGTRADLPRFEPNKLVESINRLAANTKLPLDELSFVLEDNHNQPYVRYRVTLSVASRYPTIRRFLEALQTDQPQVALDGISCERDDIAAADTTCDVTLSAFYRRQAHG